MLRLNGAFYGSQKEFVERRPVNACNDSVQSPARVIYEAQDPIVCPRRKPPLFDLGTIPSKGHSSGNGIPMKVREIVGNPGPRLR